MPITDTLLPIIQHRTLTRVAIYAILMGVYAAIPVWKEQMESLRDLADLPSQFHAALTLVLGWLLVFRTNSAYSRWWEARTLWGALVNASRNLATKVSVLEDVPEEDRAQLNKVLVAFAAALRDHLRNESLLQKLPGYEGSEDTPDHVPNYLAHKIYSLMWKWKRSGVIDGDELRILDSEALRFLDICGGCERIRKTRVVRAYRVFARQCTILFLATFPWGIVDDFSFWTIPLTVITSYFMLGLEIVAEHVEEPFGLDEDDLNLDGLCETIRSSVEEILPKAS